MVATDDKGDDPLYLADEDGTLYQSEKLELNVLGGLVILYWDPIWRYDTMLEAIKAAEREYKCTS